MQKYNLFVIKFYFKKYDLNFYLVYHFGKYKKTSFVLISFCWKKWKKTKRKESSNK